MSLDDSHSPLPAGIAAPQFVLPATPQQKTALADWLGSPVVLIFYPADFSPVCGDELAVFNELMPIFERRGAKLFGVSVDSVWSHAAYSRERRLRFPLLSDFQPRGEVSRAYNSFREEDGCSERSLFVLDSAGRVFWSYLSPVNVNPGADGVLDALDRLGSHDHVNPGSVS